MKKLMMAVAVVVVAGAALAVAQHPAAPAPEAGKPAHECPMARKKGGKPCGCMALLKDAQVKAVNIQNGVTVEITSADAAVVKKLQELAAARIKDGKFICDCAKMRHSGKPCPKKIHETRK